MGGRIEEDERDEVVGSEGGEDGGVGHLDSGWGNGRRGRR